MKRRITDLPVGRRGFGTSTESLLSKVLGGRLRFQQAEASGTREALLGDWEIEVTEALL